MKLNVACGSDSWGDVRLDIGRKSYRRGRRHRIPPDIIADARKLPFRDKSFSIVKASHIIEEIHGWKEALVEWLRVCNEKIVLKFPIDDGMKRELINGILRLSPPEIISAILCRRNGYHIWVHNPALIERILQDCGFDVQIFRKNKFRIEDSWYWRPINVGFVDVEFEIVARRNND